MIMILWLSYKVALNYQTDRQAPPDVHASESHPKSSVPEIDVLDEAPAHSEITWVTDGDLLLPGEDPASHEIGDAVHWTQVYRELIGMTASLLERSDSTLRSMSPAAAREGAATQQVLRAQREQYLARYDFWRDRASVLSSHKD
jgi:hypothetical protein